MHRSPLEMDPLLVLSGTLVSWRDPHASSNLVLWLPRCGEDFERQHWNYLAHCTGPLPHHPITTKEGTSLTTNHHQVGSSLTTHSPTTGALVPPSPPNHHQGGHHQGEHLHNHQGGHLITCLIPGCGLNLMFNQERKKKRKKKKKKKKSKKKNMCSCNQFDVR